MAERLGKHEETAIVDNSMQQTNHRHGDLQSTGEGHFASGSPAGNGMLELRGQKTDLRSDSWEVLQAQMKAAETTGSFVFAHRKLDGVTAVALAQHLHNECNTKFIDMSALGNWREASAELASAVEKGVRGARSLVLDGNDIGSSPQFLEPWCAAIDGHPGLQHISFRDACIDDVAMKRLAETLRHNTVLFSIDIGFNRISNAGIQSLINAFDENHVLLEVILDGCDVCSDVQNRLAIALQRNRDRFPNQNGCLKGLRSLRQARAEAVTALSIRTCGVRDASLCTESPRPWNANLVTDENAQTIDSSDRLTNSLLSMFAAMDPGEMPFIPDTEIHENADGVIFEAGRGTTTELNNRCEAGWRYTASDREVLQELRRKASDIKASRKHERERGDEALQRIADAQTSFRAQYAPLENHIYRMKEELAFEVASTRDEIKANLSRKIELEAAQKELETVQRDHCCYHLGAQKLENNLKIRNREVQEKVEQLKIELSSLEANVDHLDEDNERCRKLLHAVRFETETERFVPRAALEQAAAEKAAQDEKRARAEAELAKQQRRQPPAPPLELRGASPHFTRQTVVTS